MAREAAKRQLKEQAQAHDELKALEADRRGGRLPPPTKANQRPKLSIERTLEDAFGRYEDYLHARKSGIESSADFLREQRYLSEQAESLKNEEQRRRMQEMKSYLELQMKDKAEKKGELRQAERDEKVSGVVSTLPVGSDIDADEEAYVKMAMKHALDGQVEHKLNRQAQQKDAELEQEQNQLNCVAAEMQEARFRNWSERREQESSLRTTWAKQQQLKLMEATLEKAEAA